MPTDISLPSDVPTIKDRGSFLGEFKEALLAFAISKGVMQTAASSHPTPKSESDARSSAGKPLTLTLSPRATLTNVALGEGQCGPW